MTEDKWELITTVSGELQADLLRGLLEAGGIKVFLNQEGAGKVYGLTMGPMGEVQVLVPENQSEMIITRENSKRVRMRNLEKILRLKDKQFPTNLQDQPGLHLPKPQSVGEVH